jgi:hypothetical protein
MKTDKTICAANKSTYSICPSSLDQFASTQLRQYLKQATHADLPVVEKATGPAIYLACDKAQDVRDAFSIRVQGEDILISGSNPRGVLYGVYSFLEQFCGIRFFTPDFEWVPECPVLTVPGDFEYRETADFKIRQIRLELNFTPTLVDWAAKNRFNSITVDFSNWEKPEAGGTVQAARDRHLMTDGSGHAMFFFLKASEYFEKYPEWFPEVDGRRLATRNTGDNFCYSNREAVEECTRNIIAYCKRFPEMKRVNFWPGDGGYICRCEECRKKSFMELYGDLIALITARLHAGLPDIQVEQLAYNFDSRDKTLPMMKVLPRTPEIPTMFAFWGQDLTIPLAENPELSHQYVYQYIREFAERAPGQASIFSYHTDTYANSNFCPVFEPAMAADFKTFRKLGIDEVCLLWIPWDDCDPDDILWIAYQNGGLWGRLAMNLHFDVAAFRRDYYRATAGGNQAGQAEQFWNTLNTILRKLSALIFPFTPYRTSDAWGCAFNPEVFKWELTTDYGQPGKDRLKLFSQAAADLEKLQKAMTTSAESDRPEYRRFQNYVDHCVIRTRGLTLIIQAQYAMQDELWQQATELLQKALDTGMKEQRNLTLRWLKAAQEKKEL